MIDIKRRIVAFTVVAALATAAAVVYMPQIDLIQYVVPVMGVSLGALVLLMAISLHLEDQLDDTEKNFLMNGFIVFILVPSFFAAGAFMHESETSWSNGEVHYHADFEVLVTNGSGGLQELDLVDPVKFCDDTSHESTYMCKINDRTGSTEYHEHNDDRIHLEGVFKTKEDASLAAFFEQFNGELTNTRLVFPTDQGVRTFEENDEYSLKILVQKGEGDDRHWCAVGQDSYAENICNSYGERATSPNKYIVTPETQNPADRVILDTVFIVYDSYTTDQALEDVREDNLYRGRGLTKEGEGHSG
jgi:hypothetical protein